jgi:putative transposase
MPRRARVSLPAIPHHIIQRGNNRSACFYADEDYQFYLQWLSEYAPLYECQVHAYVLMTNHVHLLLTPQTAGGVGQLMKRLGQRYVQYVNRTYRRSGTLWEGRFRSCLAQDERYVLGCYRYIELNPVRANIVEHPAEYRWSSYRSNAQGEKTDVLLPHSLYTGLGLDLATRQVAYRRLFRSDMDIELVNEIRQSTNGNYALGCDRFKKEVELALGRRVTRGVSGRPKK